MSGANGIYKFLRVNREEQIDPLQTRGIRFHQAVFATITNIPSLNPIPGAVFLNDLLFPAGGVFGGPTAAAVLAAMAQAGVPVVGNEFCQIIRNADPALPVTINMGAGFTPASITIPADTTVEVCWELTSLNPAAFELSSFITQVGPGGVPPPVIPPGVRIGDVLEWNGTAWVPSSTFNIGTSLATAAILSNIQPDVAGANVNIWGGLLVNPLGVNAPLTTDYDGVFAVSVPPFNALDQFGARVVSNQNNMDPTNVALLRSSHFRSEFTNINVQPYAAPAVPGGGPTADPANPNVDPATPAPEVVFHYIGVTGAPPASVLRWGATVSGLTYANSYNILSGQEAKKDIEEASVDSRKLRDLKTFNFHYKEDHPRAPRRFGFVAEQVDGVFPGTMVEAGVKAQGNYLNLSELIAHLAGALKHVEERVSVLEEEKKHLFTTIDSLTARIAALESHA